MSTSAYTRILVVILAALALAACPGKKDKHHDDDEGGNAAAPNFYVNALAGSDTNRGAQASPFKTITHAMSLSKSGSTVQVAPGTYDVANGEIFPITVPAGVLLIGDETHKGGGSTPTSVVGGGQVPASPVGTSAALLPGTGSTIAGFTITNNNGSSSVRRGLSLGNNTVTLRNDTVTGATHQVGVYIDASINHVITGNRIVDNGSTSTGLAFSKGGGGSKVENNVITGNGFGVEYDVAGGDLGGGSAGSVGGNMISCNSQHDLFAHAPTAISISAASNFWDHSSPTIGSNAGDDMYDSSGIATINATLAAQTSNPSPCGGSTIYVNASSVGSDAGSDANPGTQALPFKTITHALTVATSGSTVQAKPGVYDTLNNGETFPIVVPAGVLLIGDETNKGGGSTPTSIVGGGQVPAFPAGTSAAVQPGTGSTIAGFTITNDNPALSGRYGVFLSNSTVTLRNNTVTGATHVVGVYVADDGGTPPTPSTNHVITGNRIVDNAPSSGEGLAFISGGAGSKVENNVITGNGFGIEYEIAGVDLGGGSAVSVGGNTIKSNTLVDLYVGVPVTVCARNNFWDLSPPAVFGEPSTPACTFAGDDICDASAGGAATIVTGNPTPACP
jgi:hypothetical protein